MTKLFEDLSAGQKEKPPVGPRITCTRLRRLREIRCELIDTESTDPNLSALSAGDAEATVEQLNSAREKNESFAAWVLRNKEAHKNFADMRSQLRKEASANGRRAGFNDDDPNAFANFSPASLQIVAKNSKYPWQHTSVVSGSL